MKSICKVSSGLNEWCKLSSSWNTGSLQSKMVGDHADNYQSKTCDHYHHYHQHSKLSDQKHNMRKKVFRLAEACYNPWPTATTTVEPNFRRACSGQPHQRAWSWPTRMSHLSTSSKQVMPIHHGISALTDCMMHSISSETWTSSVPSDVHRVRTCSFIKRVITHQAPGLWCSHHLYCIRLGSVHSWTPW